jgi:hypothetical protein
MNIIEKYSNNLLIHGNFVYTMAIPELVMISKYNVGLLSF